jgi:hypothetical protein
MGKEGKSSITEQRKESVPQKLSIECSSASMLGRKLGFTSVQNSANAVSALFPKVAGFSD